MNIGKHDIKIDIYSMQKIEAKSKANKLHHIHIDTAELK